ASAVRALVVGVFDNGHRSVRVAEGGGEVVVDGRRGGHNGGAVGRLPAQLASFGNGSNGLVEPLQRLRADERLAVDEETGRAVYAAHGAGFQTGLDAIVKSILLQTLAELFVVQIELLE